VVPANPSGKGRLEGKALESGISSGYVVEGEKKLKSI
jgi:hypothetical protein